MRRCPPKGYIIKKFAPDGHNGRYSRGTITIYNVTFDLLSKRVSGTKR